VTAFATNKWEVAAEELYRIREQMRVLKSREQDIVDVFKGFGTGLYAGQQYSIIVSEFKRTCVDLDSLRHSHPNLVEEFTEFKTYMSVKAAPVSIKV
jgi:hypothetical protein